MSEYNLFMHLKKDAYGIGHAFAELRGPEGKSEFVGFGPEREKQGMSDLGGLAKRMYGPGIERGERDKGLLDGEKPKAVTSKPIPLDREQYEKMREHFARQKELPEKYVAVGNNCVDYVIDGMKRSGVEVPELKEVFPEEETGLSKTGLAGEWSRARMNAERKNPGSSMEKEGFIIEEPAPHPQAPTSEHMLQRLGDADLPFPYDIILKRPEDWTEGELNKVLSYRFGLAGSDPLRREIERQSSAWFSHIYGDEPVKFDWAGKMVQPEPRNPIPQKESPLTAGNGEPLEAAFKRVLGRMDELATGHEGGLPGAVRNLQRGLNIAGGEAKSALKTDGDYGPKTDLAVKQTLVADGPGRITDALALGRFAEHIEKRRSEEKPGEIGAVTKEIFAPLYPGNDEREVNLVLQDYLNEQGAEPPLKLDGWLGPKSTAAFDAASVDDPDRLVRGFGQSLGLI